jgi:hypothetical protein
MLFLWNDFIVHAGTGKTKVARLYGKLLKELGLLSDGSMIEKKAAGRSGQDEKDTLKYYSLIKIVSHFRIYFISNCLLCFPGLFHF